MSAPFDEKEKNWAREFTKELVQLCRRFGFPLARRWKDAGVAKVYFEHPDFSFSAKVIECEKTKSPVSGEN